MSNGSKINLVDWNSPENIGEISDSHWVCPTGSLDDIREIEDNGQLITAQTLIERAGGRRQHLELLRFSPGFLAAIIVDEDGKTINEAGADQRFDSSISSEGVFAPTTNRFVAENRRELLVSSGLALRGLNAASSSTSSTFGPPLLKSSDYQEEYDNRVRTKAEINPVNQKLVLSARGKAVSGRLADVLSRIEITETRSSQHGKLILTQSTIFNTDLSSVIFRIRGNGQVEDLVLHKSEDLLKEIGIDYSPKHWDSDQRSRIEDPELITDTFHATAEALGKEPGDCLDLAATAIGIYRNFGQREFDPTNQLRFI